MQMIHNSMPMVPHIEVNAKKTHILKFAKGDLLLDVIAHYAQEKKIHCGYFSGIGALALASLNYFDLTQKKYLEKRVENVELVSCIGNISLNKDTGKPTVHAHIAVSDTNGQVWGGHAGPATKISITAELFLIETDGTLWRYRDQALNCNLLDLSSQ